MGWLSALFGRSPVAAHALDDSTERSFAIDVDSWPAWRMGLEAYTDPVTYAPRIDRTSAMSVPAVKRARDLVCGSLGHLQLDV